MTPSINKNTHPIIVGISGRSCSGKSVATEALANANYEIILLKADWYFKNDPCAYNGYRSWEHVDCISFHQLIHDLDALKNGQDAKVQITTPWMNQYNFEIRNEDLHKRKIIVVEGFLTLAVKELVNLLDYKIFVDVSDVNLMYRRLRRHESNWFTLEDLNYIYDVIIPVSKKYEQLQKDEAELIVDGNKSKPEIIQNVGVYLHKEILQSNGNLKISLPSKVSPWEIHPDDLVMDSLWHPIKYDNLPKFVRQDMNKLESGNTINGERFAYKKDAEKGAYQLKLRKDHKNHKEDYPVFRYYLH